MRNDYPSTYSYAVYVIAGKSFSVDLLLVYVLMVQIYTKVKFLLGIRKEYIAVLHSDKFLFSVKVTCNVIV